MNVKSVKKPPIDMLHHFFSNIRVTSDPTAQNKFKNGKEFGCEFKFEVEYSKSPDNELEYQVILSISSLESKDLIKGYDIEISAVGFFLVGTESSVNSRDGLAAVLGPTLLYGAVRELLYSLTLRGPYPPIYLPTTSFIPEDDSAKVTIKKTKKIKKST